MVTVGFFDGVHLGHRAVFARTVEAARERGVRSVAVTFDRHPREVLTPGSEPRLLTTVERRASLIEATGIDELVVLSFTKEFSQIPAEGFVERVLVNGVHGVHAVMGRNFTFGHRAAGTIDNLPELGAPFGLTAEGVELVDVNGARVSSSSVRDALAAGDLEWPRTALGRRFVLDGEVVSGHGRGKGLGFPTANLQTWPRLLLPGQGIYAGRGRARGPPPSGRDRRGHQPDVRHGAAARGGVPAGLRRRRPAWRTARARVLGASPRRGAVRHRGRAGGGDRRRRRADPGDRSRRGARTGERPPRAQAAHAVLGVDRCDRAGRGRDDGGVGHGRRPGRRRRAGLALALAERGGRRRSRRRRPRPARPPSRRAGS